MEVILYTILFSIFFLWILNRYYSLHYLVQYLMIRRTRERLVRKIPSPSRPNKRLVVSLTSIPSRINNIAPTINSILLQDLPADRIYLNLPKVSLREKRPYVIPPFIESHPRITIVRTETDSGPLMKILPTLELERDPETLIVTVDDDTIYPTDMLNTLMRYHRLLPGAALGFRGWDIPKTGRYLDSRTIYGSRIRTPRRVDILTGVSGVLYQRRFFDDDFFSDEDLPAEGYYVDDIRINGYLERHQVGRFLIPHPVREPLSSYVLTSRTNPLWKINRNGINNQIMIDYFFNPVHRHPKKISSLRRFYDKKLFPRIYPIYYSILRTNNQYLFNKRLDSKSHHRILLELLKALDDYMGRIRSVYWLDFGTLLGCIRDQKMIPWDNDMDVGILHKDHDRLLRNSHMLPAKFKIIEISRFWVYQKIFPVLNLWKRKTFLRILDIKSGYFIDMFEYEERGNMYQLLPWVMLQRYRAHEDTALRMECYPSQDIFPLQTGILEGLNFPVPNRPHNILRKIFGDDYMIPDRV